MVLFSNIHSYNVLYHVIGFIITIQIFIFHSCYCYFYCYYCYHSHSYPFLVNSLTWFTPKLTLFLLGDGELFREDAEDRLVRNDEVGESVCD